MSLHKGATAVALVASTLAACGAAETRPTTAATPLVIPSAEPASSGNGPDPSGDAGASTTVPGSSAPGPFRFPLAAWAKTAVDDGDLAGLEVTFVAKRHASGVEQEVKLVARDGSMMVTTHHKGESASSAQLRMGNAEPAVALLRSCARGRCAAQTGEPTEPWAEFEVELLLSHPKLGSFEERREAALIVARLVDTVFAPGGR